MAGASARGGASAPADALAAAHLLESFLSGARGRPMSPSADWHDPFADDQDGGGARAPPCRARGAPAR